MWRVEGLWPRIYPPSKIIFWQFLARAPEQIRLTGEILSIARCRRIQKKLTRIFKIPFLGWASGLRNRPNFRFFGIFVKFGLPHLGRYESCPDIITAIDRQLDVLMNRRSTELYIWNCPRHVWSNFRKSSISACVWRHFRPRISRQVS